MKHSFKTTVLAIVACLLVSVNAYSMKTNRIVRNLFEEKFKDMAPFPAKKKGRNQSAPPKFNTQKTDKKEKTLPESSINSKTSLIKEGSSLGAKLKEAEKKQEKLNNLVADIRKELKKLDEKETEEYLTGKSTDDSFLLNVSNDSFLLNISGIKKDVKEETLEEEEEESVILKEDTYSWNK